MASIAFYRAFSCLQLVTRSLLALDTLIDFLTMNRNLFRRIYTDANLITFNTQYGDSDLVTNHQCFANTASQNQHDLLLLKLLQVTASVHFLSKQPAYQNLTLLLTSFSDLVVE